MANKPISRKARVESHALSVRPDFNRGNQLRRDNDTQANISVSIQDVDAAIMYYFNEVIRPNVNENKEVVKVPVMYASPERWVSIQKRGFMRDKRQQLVVPAIIFRRTGIAKNDQVPISKIDANTPQNFVTFEQKYTSQNRYDQFSKQIGITPSRELYNVVVPDYITLSYEFTIWTSLIEQMNKIVERVNYTNGSYWGEPGKMRFKSQIDSFSDASEMDAGERLVKTNFSVTMYGYIIPKEFNRMVNTKKQLTPKKLIFSMDVDKSSAEFLPKDEDGNVVEGGTLPSPVTEVYGIKTSKSFTLQAGNSIVISNSGVSFNGSETLTQTISTIQPILPTSNVQFASLVTNTLGVGSGTFSPLNYTGNLNITGSVNVTQDITVSGDVNITGILTAKEYHTQFVSSSVIFQSGSTKFGDTLDDTHQFTGSYSVTGSWTLNNTEIVGVSNDTSLTDSSQTELVTEHAVKVFAASATGSVANEQTYLRKNFYKLTNSITVPSTASFNAVTASAPSPLSATNENDFIFFINGQYMEHDALTIQQAGANLLLKVATGSIGYNLETDDEIVALGKFNS
tara:strand:+ start:1764 stop:3470 length:1707 start_codon:yes stop_codon:yes gene_type:complete